MIVGLAGFARSGKDEAAKALIAQGWERRSFADILRKFVYRMNPMVGISHYGQEVFLCDVIDRYTWDGYKETEWGAEIRRLLQRVGTECGRQLINDSVWIDATLGPDVIAVVPNCTTCGNPASPHPYRHPVKTMNKYVPESKIVVPDVRFPNEFNEIQNRGGMVIRIVRPGNVAANDHVSEHALADYGDYYDEVIINNGSINALHDKVRSAVAKFF